ncbi:MAG: hypothetical protein ACI8PQ_000448 [Planctomycetota bacterium]
MDPGSVPLIVLRRSTRKREAERPPFFVSGVPLGNSGNARLDSAG